MPQQFVRKLAISRSAADLPADAAVPCTLATPTAVQRDDGGEVLDCSAAGVDLTRAPLPLIVGHDQTRLAVGVVENIQADGRRVTGSVRFGTSPEAQQIRADVLAGIHQSLSVGYSHTDDGRQDAQGNLVYRWQPHEVSIVSVPADPNSGFFRSKTTPNNTMNTTNHTAAPAAIDTLAQRAAEISELCTRHAVPGLAAELIRSGADVSFAKDKILSTIAVRDAAAGGHQNTAQPHADTNTSSDASDEKELIVRSLVARMGGKPGGDVIRSTDTVGLTIRALEMAGQRVGSGMSRSDIITRGMGLHGTSDFPALLGAAVNRVLHTYYTHAPVVLKELAKLTNLPDFREKSVIRMGSTPSLELVNEHGEFTGGTVSHASNGWRLFTYGRMIGLTRQALINDDLQAFAELLRSFGQSAARREADELVAALLNPALIDGEALFSTDRNSQITTKLTQAGIGAAVQALRGQRDGGGLVLQEPSTLLVPAALEMTARQLVAEFSPTKAGDVQPYGLSVAVEPRLDASSATAWYLVAGNQSALEYGYLDGNAGIQIDQREGFEVDGLEVKARLDFGCGWVAPVGWVKSLGTV